MVYLNKLGFDAINHPQCNLLWWLLIIDCHWIAEERVRVISKKYDCWKWNLREIRTGAFGRIAALAHIKVLIKCCSPVCALYSPLAGPQKRADSYFPPEDRVRLVRLVSNRVLPGEKSGESSVE